MSICGPARQPKLVTPRLGEMFGPVHLRGEADIGMRRPAELLPVADSEIVEPQPPERRRTIEYGAAMIDGSPQSDGDRTLPACMRSAAAREVRGRTGLDPV